MKVIETRHYVLPTGPVALPVPSVTAVLTQLKEEKTMQE